jgi:hypothetical protein
MRRASIAAVTLVLLATWFGAVDDRRGGAIPWRPTLPARVAEPPLSSSCTAPGLRAELEVQGATGNLSGRNVRNVGRAPVLPHCTALRSVRGWPCSGDCASHRRLCGRPARSRLVYHRASSLRALGPGRSAVVPVLWSNWCPPDVVITSTGTPPSRLVLVLPEGGEVTAAVDRAQRCNDPSASPRSRSRPGPARSPSSPSRRAPPANTTLRRRASREPLGCDRLPRSSFGAHVVIHRIGSRRFLFQKRTTRRGYETGTSA